MSADRSLLRFLVGVSIVVALYYFLSWVGPVLMPFVLAGVAAYLINPAIVVLEARGYRRDRLVAGLFLGAFALLVLAANIVIPWALETASGLQAKLPEYLALFRQVPGLLEREVVAKLPIGGETAASGLSALKLRFQDAATQLPQALLNTLPIVLGLALVPFVMYFVLLEGPSVIEQGVRICPSRHVEKVLSLICQVDAALGAYVRGLLLEGLVVSVLAWAGLWALGVRHAFEIGLLTGITNMIPYLGPVVGGVVGAVVAFAQFRDVAIVVQVLLLAGAVQFIDNWIVAPAIMRTTVEIHPVLMVFSLLVGGQLFGFWGLLFAVPAACILKETLGILYDWYIAESGMKKSSLSRHAVRLPYL